jgi:hypothetical protein
VCDRKYVVKEGSPLDETSSAGGASAWDALMPCERDEMEAALWQLPEVESASRHAAGVHRHVRRLAKRSARKAHAAARRKRILAHAKRLRTSDAAGLKRAH